MARVLVVDDEASIRIVMREVLAENTHQVSFAANVREAFARMTETEFDVALLDKNLPDGSGLQIAERLRADQPFAESIILTAYSSMESAIDAIKLGVFDWIQKPIPDVTRLLLVVEKAAERSRLRREKARLIAELADRDARYQRTLDGANDGIWDWDLRTDKIFYSARWKAMVGLNPEQSPDSPTAWMDRVHVDDRNTLKSAMDRHLNGEVPQFVCEYRIRHESSGAVRWMLARGQALRDGTGRPIQMAGSQTDITDRRRAVERLEHDATHDALTGLANRALLNDRLTRLIANARRYKDETFAVLYLDVDRFKVVNDGLGHVMGDELLFTVARRLETCVRAVDTVARIGGDEFVVVLESVGGVEGATQVATRILAELNRPVLLGGYEVATSASIGVLVSNPEYGSPVTILRDADIAMYRAKTARSGHAVFDTTMQSRAHDTLALQSNLRTALQRSELRCQYQPVVRLGDHRVTGFELLLRWQHPQRGNIPPYDFIPLAEESGLIVGIGEWVLSSACSRLRQWAESGVSLDNVTLGVNVSAQQLRSGTLPETLDRLLEESRVPARCLELELTETTLMESVEGAADTLRRLKKLGVRIALDDFGTGFSSLSYLDRFPIDRLKIDRSFISDVDVLASRREIVRAVISLGKSLHLDVVAEGVETPAQLEVLLSLGCSTVQGFLFARPMEVEQAAILLGQPLPPRAATAS
jgi:diguanylate cyclase (GGDEF)-like protein/PAS domain S-box-containing protein